MLKSNRVYRNTFLVNRQKDWILKTRMKNIEINTAP
jgi:hypothetical protein